MSVSFLTTLVCRAEAVPAYSKSIFSPKKRANNIEPVYISVDVFFGFYQKSALTVIFFVEFPKIP
jgi:hypothetical protein